MKQHPIVIMIDRNIKNIFLVSAQNYSNKSNLLGKFSSLIFHSGGVATIPWIDDSQILKIQARIIDIVIKFNTFLQNSCE